MNKYLEMRSICLIEPETEEFVQVTYLCDLDSNMYEDEILDTCGGLRNVGMANDKEFMALGLYPVSLYYEKEGKTMRARENSMSEFDLVEDNIYRPNTDGINLLCRIKHLKKKRQQAAVKYAPVFFVQIFLNFFRKK